ncbi:hypothetical protein HY994_02920 [Candidatus Micrarchaeota archaeon]|nr:hypothetical protein [Candidatus Micrarchaeota archaeon]
MSGNPIGEFAEKKGIALKGQKEIAEEAKNAITKKHGYSIEEIKQNFDSLLLESEGMAYRIFLKYQQEYGRKALEAYFAKQTSNQEAKRTQNTARIVGNNFSELNKFFLSLGQARKARAGKTFESIHNTMFKTLGYPFTEQAVINGKPDFLMPSKEYYGVNPMDCIIFTSKRTLRERWRQIVTEGTKGLGFYLATIDDAVSEAQLKEMLNHRIYLVVPEEIRRAKYPGAPNVISFREFFEEHLDPKVKVWKRKGVA